MFLLTFALSLFALWLNWGTPLRVPAIIVAGVALFTLGVSRNFSRDPQNLPGAITSASMVVFIASIIMVIAGFVLR